MSSKEDKVKVEVSEMRATVKPEKASITGFGDTPAEVRADVAAKGRELFGGEVVITDYDGRAPSWYFHPVTGTIWREAASGKKLYASMYVQRADDGPAATAEQAELPRDSELLTIGRMREGDTGWTVPWAMKADRWGKLWLSRYFSVSKTQAGTANMLITRAGTGFVVSAPASETYSRTDNLATGEMIQVIKMTTEPRDAYTFRALPGRFGSYYKTASGRVPDGVHRWQVSGTGMYWSNFWVAARTETEARAKAADILQSDKATRQIQSVTRDDS